MTEAPVNECERCGGMGDAKLCDLCSAETIRALSMLAPIIGTLRTGMTDIRASRTDNVRVDGTHERQLGADFDLSDRSHALYATVANWCVGWSLALNITPPAHLAGYEHEHAVTGLPDGITAWIAAPAVATWLIATHDQIEQHADAGDYADAIVRAITTEARKTGHTPRPRRVTGKACRECRSTSTLHLDWPLGGERKLRCTACGGEWECGPILSRLALQGA